MAMLRSGVSIRLPAAGFDKEFYIQHHDEFGDYNIHLVGFL